MKKTLLNRHFQDIMFYKFLDKNILNFYIKPELDYLPFNTKIPFTENIYSIYHGWSYPEKDRRWSIGKESNIVFKLNKNFNKMSTYQLNLLARSLGIQNINVLLNRTKIGDFDLSGDEPTMTTLTFKGSLLLEDTINELQFILPNAKKPDNGDPRVLAIALVEFSIDE